MGRAAPRDRGQEAGRERHARGPARVLRGQGGEVVDARRRRLRRAAAAHGDREIVKDEIAAGLQGLQATECLKSRKTVLDLSECQTSGPHVDVCASQTEIRTAFLLVRERHADSGRLSDLARKTADELGTRGGDRSALRIGRIFRDRAKETQGRQGRYLENSTVLKQTDLDALEQFFAAWAARLLPVLVPGANVVVASNPLLSYIVSNALSRSGLERRGEIVRLVMTMRGGDRPKDAHVEFSGVSVMPRSMWEPWLVFRKPLDGRVQDNLRKWGTGGFRRISADRPFGDVVESSPTRPSERALAPHPSLKPQAFMRQLVRAVLPLGKGTVLDPFAGSGSTLAACEVAGYESVGLEKDPRYFNLAVESIPRLANLPTPRGGLAVLLKALSAT